MKRIFTYIWLVLFPLALHAVQAKPGTGLFGDENYHYRIGEHSLLTHEMHQRMAAAERAKAPQLFSNFPKQGEVRSIVILVNFTDMAFRVPNPNESFTRLLNEEGYSDNSATGSARDYFIASSMGIFKPQFDVYGPYNLEHDYAYYGANNRGHDNDPRSMIIEACRMADADGVDFTQYDLNNDGRIDNVFVYYAGYNEAEGAHESTIWPHRSIITTNNTFDGKRLYDYACTSELKGTTGVRMCGIGTFCHEFSHVLGLSDFYNTESSTTYTVGSWEVMCSGNYNNDGRTPPTYTALDRFMVDWSTPQQISELGEYRLSPIATTGNIYLLAAGEHNLVVNNPNFLEYWLIENRQRVGWDAPEGALPGTGLLISHITFDAVRWSGSFINNQLPLGYDICEAYNKNPTRSSASDTYPGSMHVTTFVPTFNNGDKLQSLALTYIQELQDLDVQFHLGPADPNGFLFVPEQLDTVKTDVIDGESFYHIDTLTVNLKEPTDTAIYAVPSNKYFQISKDGKKWASDTVWWSCKEDEPFSSQLYIRFSYSHTCISRTTVLFFGIKNHFKLGQMSLTGIADRPVMIEPVTILNETNINPYSATLHWAEQEDAEVYYLLFEENISLGTPIWNKIYQGTDYPIYPPDNSITLSGLHADTEYRYTLNCAESKGCESHLMVNPILRTFRTPAANKDNKNSMYIRIEDGMVHIYFNQAVSQGSELSLYTTNGLLVAHHILTGGNMEYSFSASGLTHGRMYLLKLTASDKLQRKEPWIKFVY